jgi:hypothetical protein
MGDLSRLQAGFFVGFILTDFFITHNSRTVLSIIKIYIYQTIAYNLERCLLGVLTLNDLCMTLTLTKTEIFVSSIT